MSSQQTEGSCLTFQPPQKNNSEQGILEQIDCKSFEEFSPLVQDQSDSLQLLRPETSCISSNSVKTTVGIFFVSAYVLNTVTATKNRSSLTDNLHWQTVSSVIVEDLKLRVAYYRGKRQRIMLFTSLSDISAEGPWLIIQWPILMDSKNLLFFVCLFLSLTFTYIICMSLS